MIDSFYIRKYGGADRLERGKLPAPALGARDVRIQVHAASVNPLDLKIRSGALDVALARALKVNPLLWPIFWMLGAKPHAAAKRVNAHYRYLFMRADGLQLEQMNPLIEQGIIRPIIDRVFPFEQTAQAIAHCESGQARGKVVIQMRED